MGQLVTQQDLQAFLVCGDSLGRGTATGSDAAAPRSQDVWGSGLTHTNGNSPLPPHCGLWSSLQPPPTLPPHPIKMDLKPREGSNLPEVTQ